MADHIAEKHLLAAFNEIKGKGSQKSANVNIEDFKAAVIKYNPASINDQVLARKSSKGAVVFDSTVEVLFRNICETISPEVEGNFNDVDEAKNNRMSDILLTDLGTN